MNPGDVVRTHMWDASIGHGQHAFKVQINDLTPGHSGSMVASAANGFMNTNIVTCNGTPFNFQPLFNTARKQNSIQWSVLLSGILTEYETGHFESCTRPDRPGRFGRSASSSSSATAHTRRPGRRTRLKAVRN